MEVGMSKKYHTDSVAEYMFLKSKVIKLFSKQNPAATLRIQRAKKQARKFVLRLREIEKYHSDMGWPHPEAHSKPREDLQMELESLKRQPGKDIMTNPDGSLYQKDSLLQSGEGFVISTKGVLNPDGTMFETPILPGAVLDPNIHSENKIKEFLENNNDEILRAED
jgi:hypothetical protein